MACPEKSSTITFRLDSSERFVSFEYHRSLCGQVLASRGTFSDYCRGKNLTEILRLEFEAVAQDIPTQDDEERFYLFLEWDALKCAVGQFLGVDEEGIDCSRCQPLSVKHDEAGLEVTELILPPQNLPDHTTCQSIFRSA